MPLSRTWRSVPPCMDTPLHTVTVTRHHKNRSPWCYTRRIVFPWRLHTLTRLWHPETKNPAFICKESGSSVSRLPMLVILSILQTSSAVCCSEFWTSGGSSAPQTIFVQPIANCLITNMGICSRLKIILKSSSRRPTITTSHVPEIMILTRCCGSPMSLARSSSVPSGLLESIQSRATTLRLTPQACLLQFPGLLHSLYLASVQLWSSGLFK